MEADMNGYKGRHGWTVVLAAVLLSAIAGIIAYNIGVSHGIALGAPAQGSAVPPYGYGWYRPWGLGFGFPALLFIFLWVMLLRGLWWGGPSWRHRCYGGPPSMRSAFEDWHRQAHGQMKESPSADDPGRRG
jgi:hypothetical protein